MGLNYIGSKVRLAPWIINTIKTQYYGLGDFKDSIFCEPFAGTGIISKRLKPFVKGLVVSDLEYYSYVLNKNYLGSSHEVETDRLLEILEKCNSLHHSVGFITENYTELGIENRKYFSIQNGMKIDAIRDFIFSLRAGGDIDENEYFYLLTSLIEGADKIANVASVYAAYLKQIKPSALEELVMLPVTPIHGCKNNTITQADATRVLEKNQYDIAYIDTPYNHRQYGSNYHLLNTIAQDKEFIPQGKTGLPPRYNRSDFCAKRKAKIAFTNTFYAISKTNCKLVVLSYNNEGILSSEVLKQIMQKYGTYTLSKKAYSRYKADNARTHKAIDTTEYLHILKF